MVSNPNKVRSVTLTNWEAVRDSLPYPDTVWRWSETDMQHKTLYIFMVAGLIKSTESDDQLWRTTETLWEYVQETALPDEDIGKPPPCREE